MKLTIFKSTHPKLCFQILRRVYAKLKIGQVYDPIKVEDNFIINGHHRYVCLCMLGLEIQVQNWTRSLSIPAVQCGNVQNEW